MLTPVNKLPSLIPLDIRGDTPNPLTPWEISSAVFERMKISGSAQKDNSSYRKIVLLPSDPEWRFVWRLFYFDKPNRWNIKVVHCIHNRHQTAVFDGLVVRQDKEASKFPANWESEPNAELRKKVSERWKASASIFSPLATIETDGRRYNWEHVKVLPLWHGTRAEICASICDTGFTFFGKTTISGKKEGDPKSTDAGFFGSGIYFTNSSRYAADIYSQGHLLLSWISMREPFPVVDGDISSLAGQGAYKHYNAHYAPVSSRDPANPFEPNYYPPKSNQAFHCDEIVVFQSGQILPRFWVELEIADIYLKKISQTPEYVEDLIPFLLHIMQNEEIDRDRRVRQILGIVLSELLQQDPLDDLNDQQQHVYETLRRIFDSSGKVDRTVKTQLVEITKSLFSTHLPEQTPAYTLNRQAVASPPTLPPCKIEVLPSTSDQQVSSQQTSSYNSAVAQEKNPAAAKAPVPTKPSLNELKEWNDSGEKYRTGNGVTQDYLEAVRLFRLAADQGYADAQVNLGFCYEHGQGVGKNLSEAVKYYRLAADQGYADAQYILGVCYEWGEGVGQDSSEAMKYYRLAADQGNALAQRELGFCYYYGQGVGQDSSEAVKYYRLAADQGYALAQRELGVCYEWGEGVGKNFSEAVKYYRLAADQGNAHAQYGLGVCYENGQGVEKNLREAVKYYRLAADQGDANAKQRLAVLSK